MKVPVYNKDGVKTKDIDLDEDVFGITPVDHVIYLDVKNHLANLRQGTHKSKERAEVNFTTKKMKKQKGTGGARAGSMKSPVFVGGGTIFGPRPRDYSYKVNKKEKDLARKSALSHKAKSNGIIVVEDFTFDKPKTTDYINFASKLNLPKKHLFVLPDYNKNIYLSSRNIKSAEIRNYAQMNTYDIVNASVLLIAESSLEKINNLLK